MLQVVAPVTAAGTGLVVVLAYRQRAPLLLAMGIAVGVAVIVAVLMAFAESLAVKRQRRRAAALLAIPVDGGPAARFDLAAPARSRGFPVPLAGSGAALQSAV